MGYGERTGAAATAELPRGAAQAMPASSLLSGWTGAPSARLKPPKPGRAPRVPRSEILTVTTQLAVMVRAGVDLASALDSLARQCRSDALRQVLKTIHEDISGGVAISEALRRQQRVFGESFVATVAAGEASGRIAEVLEELAELQRGELKLRGALRTLLGYPILLSSVSGLVLFALAFFVVPQFAKIFEEFETPLPVLTQALLAVTGELRCRWWLWCLLAVPASLVAASYWRSPAGKVHRDRLMINGRLIRDITRSLIVGRSFRLLGIMIDSGVPLVESIRLVRSSLSNSLVRDVFRQLEDDVVNGRGLENCLRRAEVIPPAAAEMIATAERTGTLGLASKLIAAHFEEEGQSRLKSLVALLEPAIIIVMGAVVAVVVLAVMLPMFDLATVGGKPA